MRVSSASSPKAVRRVKASGGRHGTVCTSEITYIPGRGSESTLVSSRLVRHYGRIVQDIDRTMLGYELMKLLHKVTERMSQSGTTTNC
jgi:hypothetical protein